MRSAGRHGLVIAASSWCHQAGEDRLPATGSACRSPRPIGSSRTAWRNYRRKS